MVIVVGMPIAWVWAAGAAEPGTIYWLRQSLEDAAVEAEDVLATGADPRFLEGVARDYDVRLRLVDGDRVVADHDHANGFRLFDPIQGPFFGPGGVPELTHWDEQQGSLPERPDVIGAGSETATRCVVGEHDLLLACVGVRRVPDGRVIHLERGRARLVRSLYESRFQLTAVALVVFSVGALSALLLGMRMVSPIESLRDQVVDRMGDGPPTRPVFLDRDDELGELASAFNQLLATIAERNDANAIFAADLAHELKNPVAAVRTAVEVLAADRPLEGERKERLLRVLGDATGRMDAVVQAFLELARAEAGLPGRDRERLRLDELVRRLIDAAAGTAAFSLEAEAVEVEGVPERLETAIRNVLSNAAHYAGPSGWVAVRVEARDAEVQITVEDSGPGIPDADLPRIFERYYSKREGGTGIGLALVKAILVAHHGRVSVVSPTGGGARFTLSLPRA